MTQAAPTFSGTRVVSYLLDLAGNKTRTTWADGYTVTYAYDALNRMTTATENGTFLLSTYIYDTLSRRTSLVYGNGATQGYTYSTQGDLLTLASTLTATSNTYTNTFTPAHQLMSEAASNAAWAYVPAAFQTTNYAAANALNQYVNITVGANPTQTLGYDANGNLTGDGVWTFAYDAQNMLRSAVSAASTSTYQYDPLGRRQMLTEGGVTTTFLHDGDEEIADYSAAAAVLRRYVPGPGTDMPIAMVTPSGGSNTRKYFHTNRQGSTIAMSADDGTMSEGPYTYDAYGNGAPATGVPFKYTGRRLDAGTGLYYYRARYYLAALGRFLQVDPVGYGTGLNLYSYGSNDAVNFVDPSGRARVCTQSTGSRIKTCVNVDGDNNGTAEANDLSPSEKQRYATAFRDFINKPKNRNRDISGEGHRRVEGNGSEDDKRAVRVTSQFVGAAIADSGDGTLDANWKGLSGFVVYNGPSGAPPSWMCTPSMGGCNGDWMGFSGRWPWWFVNGYTSPSDLARIMLHEMGHLEMPSHNAFDHQQIDKRAVQRLHTFGLGSCSSISGWYLHNHTPMYGWWC